MRENLLEPACTWCHMDMVGLELENCLAVTSCRQHKVLVFCKPYQQPLCDKPVGVSLQLP